MTHTRYKVLGFVFVTMFSLWLLLAGMQNATAAPGPTDTIWLDGISNPFMPVDVAVNSKTGLAYVVNQGAGHIWVISGTEYIKTLDPPGGGCPGPTSYGACLNSVNVNSFTGKAYVTKWFNDWVHIISGTELLVGGVYGGKGPAGTVMHPLMDTVYALGKWAGSITVIKGDSDRVRISASVPNAGCVNPTNGYAYIASSGANNVLVINDMTQIATIPVGSYPNSGACTSSGYVYIVNSGSNPATVSVITGTQVIATIPIEQSTTCLGVDGYWGTKLCGSTNIIAINEQSGYVYVSNWGSGSVSVISGTTWITDVTVGSNPNAVGVYTPTNSVYVANIGSDTISVISGTEVTAAISVGDYPIALAVNSHNGYVYVANRDSDSVSIIQNTGVAATIGRMRPRALVAQGGRIYSANSNGTVSVIEGSAPLANVMVGNNPQAIIGDGAYIYVANAGSASVSIISGTMPIATLAVGGEPRALAVYTPTNRVYVANVASNTVSVLKGLMAETTITVGGGPGALAADPATGNIFVANTLSNTVTVINGVSKVRDISVDNGPQAIVFNPANGYAYVANTLSNTVSILDGVNLLATRPVGAMPSAMAVHPGTGYVYVAARGDDAVNILQGTEVVATIPVGDQPGAIAIDRNLGFVYVTCEGSDRVWVLSGTVSLDLDFGVGDQPVDVVVKPDSGEAYIANYGSVSLSRVRNLPPLVSGMTPDRTTVRQGTNVTLSGGGYFLAPAVWLNSTPLENVQRLNRSTLSGYVPDTLPVGEYTITVRTPDGLTGTKISGFMVTHPAPVVAAIWPDTLPNYVTTTVRITGSNFISTPSGVIGTLALQDITWETPNAITANVPLALAPGRYQTVFFDNLEQELTSWSPQSNWQITSTIYHSPNRAWNGTGSGTLSLTVPLNLTALPNPQISFWEQRSGFYSYYHAYVELSTNNGQTWQTLRDTITDTGWGQTVIDLGAYTTVPTATVRFRISGASYSQWTIDDVHVGSMADGLLVTNPGPGSPTGYLTAPFTVTNQIHHFVFDPIPSPQVIDRPFTITVRARDVFSYSVQAYTGAITLSATASISPSVVGPFTGGVWSGQVQIDAVQAGVIMTAANTLSEAIQGSSATFDVSALPPIVEEMLPNTFPNHVTTTVRITGSNFISPPVAAIGALPLQDVTWISSNVITANVRSPEILFSDDMEAGNSSWQAESSWGLTSTNCHSGSTCWTDSPGGNYANSINTSLYLSQTFNLTAIASPVLSFWHRYDLKSSYDNGYVEISADGGASWSTLATYTGSAGWQQVRLNLTAYANQPAVRFRFRIRTDGSVTMDGWYIDDVTIGSTGAPGVAPGRYQTILFDNLEQNSPFWSPQSNWQITSTIYHSPNRAWNGTGSGTLSLTVPLNLTALPNPKLSFWEQRSGFYSSYHAYVELSTNNGQTWQTLRDTITDTGWGQTVIDLGAYTTVTTATVHFRISAYGQWAIDDVHVGSMADGLLVTNPGPGSPAGYLTAPFTVTNQVHQLTFNAIPSPQLLNVPFTITAVARDVFGFLNTDYSGTANLNASVPVIPTTIGPFINGIWSGPITVTTGHLKTIITAADTASPALVGVSNAFNVLDPNLAIREVYPSTISNDVTSTIYITTVGMIASPTVRIGRETITDVTVVDTDTIAVQVPPGLAPLTYGALLYDDVEHDDVTLWQADAPWKRTTTSAHSATHSWEVTFTNAMSASLALSGTLDLTQLPDPILDFWHQLDLDTGDAAVVEVSTEPSIWRPLQTFSADQSLWGHYQLDLRPYASHDAVRIRFRVYNKNTGGSGVSWRLDDIAVTSAAGGVALINPGELQTTDLWRGSFVITNQAQRFDVELPRAEQVAAVPFTVTLTARDRFGYVATGHSGSVTLSASVGSISPTIASGFAEGKLSTAIQLDTVRNGMVIAATSAAAQGVSAPFDVVNQERAAYLHLTEQLGLYDRFWVYSDGGAYTNHYGISYMGVYTDVQMNAYYTPTVHSGATAIRVSYTASDTTGLRWGGAAWLDPEGNWSGATGGFYLRGTTELAFWAKGERGGERVKFGMGGVPDGAPARYIVVALSDQWQRYTIPLNGLNVDQVIEGFYWAANCDDNPNGATFYLDDIQYLYQSNNAVYVYQDQFSLDNFYVPSGWMGDLNQIHIDEGVPDSTYPGATTTRFTYDSASGTNDWAGVYYLWPDNNWGTDPAGGHSLAGAKQLAVRMRGARGGERITIGMGGVTGAYGDSTGKHERTITLSSNWQEYTIDLTGTNLSRVVGGFYWSASRYWNPGGATFYLDDVRYVFEDTPWPHLISSYVGDPTQPDDQYFAGSAHIYDNALAILAFLARGTTADIRQARAMADALVYVQNHDPSFTDGRLRSAYHAEALSGSGGIAWYWNDAYGAGTHVGNMSWVILALTRMYQTTGEAQYRDAAIRLGNWIHDHTYDERFYGGYTGGYEGWEPAQIRLDWKSTEHNIDAYVAFATLYDITHETKWWEHALHAKRFVRSMWFENTLGGGTPVGWFWTGTKGDFLVYGDWEPTVVVSNTCQAPTVTMPHNHYYPTRFGPALENIQLSTNYTATAHSGESSLRLVYPAGTSDWAGLIALEGDHNWGTAGQGYDMVGARSLTVWMKSVVGGEKVVIGIGGVPYTTTTLPVSTTLPGTYASALTQTAILTTNWQPYTITIPPTHTLDMQHHIGGFFAYLSPADNPTGAEILLDDIVYHFDDSLGEMLNYNVLVADVNSWGLMALGEQLRYGKTVDWIHHAFLVTETIASQAVSGIDFDIDKDGIWPEGTGQAILAFQATGRQSWSTTILSDAAFVQEHAPRANRKGIVAALHDCLTTNLGWFYYNRLHVAPTAWYIFAMRGHNPYWGIPITAVRRQGPVIQFITYTYPSTYLLLQGSNFNAPTVTLESPFSSTMLLGVSAFTSTTLTATLPTPLSPGTAYTITVISPDTQQDRKTFTVGCLPVAGTRFTYRHLALDTFVFSATVAAGYPPLTYTWDWGEPSSLPLHGIAYGPFRDGQRPGGLLPSETELREDLDILSRHSDHIRLYGTQEATPDIVRIAAEKGISITLGAWIDTDTITNELELASLISLTNHYSNVVAATVGNERLLFHEISETQLISYIQQVRQAVDVPVSTAETWDVWLAHPQLADAVDFLLVHIHPYWEGVPVERAVEQVANHYAQLQAAYPGKPIVIGETGWPTSGDDYGAAHPGEAEQQQFVEAFTAWARANNVSYFYFDAFDEAWKCDPGPAVECHWGLYTTGRQPKPVVATRAITTVSVITHTFSAPGNYNVTLVVNNRCGQDVYSDTIFVGHPSKIFLPLVIR